VRRHLADCPDFSVEIRVEGAGTRESRQGRRGAASNGDRGVTAMTIASETRETGLARRDLLALVGTAAAVGFGAASPAFAQSQTPMSGTAPAQPQGKSTVTLDRLPMGVLLIGIDRVVAQNRIDIPTFNALGQARQLALAWFDKHLRP
jgi:hypothetical protein